MQRYTVRADGFASLHGPYGGDEAVTRPLTFQGKSLTLNYATGAAGSLRVEVQDAAGRPVRLRFVLWDADVYAFRFE